MRFRRRSLSFLTLLVVPLCACFPVLAVAGPEGCGTVPGERVARAINAARAEGGAMALRIHPRLVAAAERHSADMAWHRFMDHTGYDGSTFTQRALEAGYDIGSVGEVVAAGHATPEAAVAGWMRSRRHRDILLLPTVVHVGAACARSTRGSLYWTAVVGLPTGQPAGQPAGRSTGRLTGSASSSP